MKNKWIIVIFMANDIKYINKLVIDDPISQLIDNCIVPEKVFFKKEIVIEYPKNIVDAK